MQGEAENEQKKWVIWQLNLTRGITFALQASQDLPPTKEEHNKKKPNWTKIGKARKELLSFMEAHQKGISHPFFFEEYMGLGHVFDAPPEPEKEKSALSLPKAERSKWVAGMKERIMKGLEAHIATHGNSFDVPTEDPTES